MSINFYFQVMHHNILAVVVALLFCSVQTRLVSIVSFGADFTGASLSDGAFFEAISNASRGDTVIVPGGIFIISKPIKLKSGLTLQGNSPLSTIRQTAKQPFFSQDLVSDIRITDIALDGDNVSTHGFVISNSLRVSIERVNIRNVASWADVFGPIGIYFSSNVSNSLIDNCTMFSIAPNTSYGGGVRITGGSNNVIQNNRISATGRGGIFLSDNSTFNVVKNNVVTKSGLSGSGCMSIESWGNCDYTVIEDNNVDHWISLDTCHHCAVRRNNVSASDHCYYGLAAVASISTVFTDNQVLGGQGTGFIVSNNPRKDYLLFARNTISGMTSYGVELVGGDNGTYHHYFYNNTIMSAVAGVDTGHGFRINGNAYNIVLENNIIYNNTGYAIQTFPYVDMLEFFGNTIKNNKLAYLGYLGTRLVWENNTIVNSGITPTVSSYNVTNQRPIAVINAPSTVYVGDVISISSASRDPDGSIVQLLWDLDQGYVREEQTVLFSYDKPGKKRVTLVAWDNGGRGARTEVIITVLDPTVAVPVITISTPTVVDAITDVVPIIECYSIGSNGAVTVYFGYNNPTSQSVALPRGPQNNIEPADFNGNLMTLFSPGRTQYYPAAAFDLTFSSMTTHMAWTLGSYKVSADLSDTSLQCPSQASFELILTAPSINSTQLDDILNQISRSLNISRDDITSYLRQLNCTVNECTYSLVVTVNTGLEQQVISQLKELIESIKSNASEVLADTPDVTVKEVITRPTGREVTGVKFDPPTPSPSLSSAHSFAPMLGLLLLIVF